MMQPATMETEKREAALENAILHRKTASGGRVGDLFMSVIHTAKLAKIDVLG